MDRQNQRKSTRVADTAAKEKEEERKRLEMALSRNDEVRLDETWEGSSANRVFLLLLSYSNRLCLINNKTSG